MLSLTTDVIAIIVIVSVVSSTISVAWFILISQPLEEQSKPPFRSIDENLL